MIGTQSYNTLHKWVRNNFGKPKTCVHCGNTRGSKRLEWANKDGAYTKNRQDWMELCAKCHRVYDGSGSIMKERFANRTHCANGHDIRVTGFFLGKTGHKKCKVCAADSQRRYLKKKKEHIINQVKDKLQ